MADISKISPDDGSTILNIKDSNAVHYGDQSKGYVGKNHLHVTQPSIFNLGGVKVTVNSDGSVTFNGTATSNNSFSLTDWTENLFPEGDYLLSDVNGQAGKIFTFIARKKGTSGVVDNTIDTHAMQNKPFTVDYTEYDYYKVAIYFFSGQTFNNLTIYPMIRLASISDSTYEPWCMSNRELTEAVTPTNQSMSALVGTLNTGNSTLRKCGKIVALSAQLSGVTATKNTWTNVIELDSASTPSVAYQGILYSPAGFGQFKVNTNGKIQIYPYSDLTNSNLFLNATYMI